MHLTLAQYGSKEHLKNNKKSEHLSVERCLFYRKEIMTETITLRDFGIPYGVLHDQKLLSAKKEDNKIIFSFEIKLYEQNFSNSDIYNKFREYNRCDMIVELWKDNPLYDIMLTYIYGKHNKIKGYSIEIDEFIEAINDCNAEFITCFTNGIELIIELCITNGFHSDKYRKYRKCNNCKAEFEATKVAWKWYSI